MFSFHFFHSPLVMHDPPCVAPPASFIPYSSNPLIIFTYAYPHHHVCCIDPMSPFRSALSFNFAWLVTFWDSFSWNPTDYFIISYVHPLLHVILFRICSLLHLMPLCLAPHALCLVLSFFPVMGVVYIIERIQPWYVVGL